MGILPWSFCWITPGIFQLEIIGEFFPCAGPGRGDANGPHRLAGDNTYLGGTWKLLELIGGNGVYTGLEFKCAFAKGLHLPAWRSLGSVSEKNRDLLPFVQKSSCDHYVEDLGPWSCVALGVPPGDQLAVSIGVQGAEIDGPGIIKLRFAKISYRAKCDHEIIFPHG